MVVETGISMTSVGNTFPATLTIGKSLSFGSLRIEEPLIFVAEGFGRSMIGSGAVAYRLLGIDTLANGVILLDLKGHRLYVRKGSGWNPSLRENARTIPLPIGDATFMRSDKGTWVITEISPHKVSTPSSTDPQIGDQLIAVGGKEIALTTIAHILRLAAEAETDAGIKVTLRHPDNTLTFDVILPDDSE